MSIFLCIIQNTFSLGYLSDSELMALLSQINGDQDSLWLFININVKINRIIDTSFE